MVYVKRKKTVISMPSIEVVSDWWNHLRDSLLMEGGGGSRFLGNGVTVYADPACTVEVGRVSYNGRIWPSNSST
jgi:hypothetical protein